MAKPPPETVLYITDVWLMLPDDALRKGRSTPLEWGKFRSPADTSEAGQRYRLRRQAVKASGPEGMAILGIFDEVLADYGYARTATLRGWLVNYDYVAATDAQLAQAIGWADVEMVTRALAMLEKVGLLMRLPLPDLPGLLKEDRTLRPEGAAPPAKPQADQPARRKRTDREAEAAKAQRAGKAKRRRGRPAAGKRPASGRTPAGPERVDVRQETGHGETPNPPATAAPPPGRSADGNGERARDSKTATASPPPDADAAGSGDGQAGAGQPPTSDAPAGPSPPVDPAARPSPPPPADAVPSQPTEADHRIGAERPPGCWPESVIALVDRTMVALYPSDEALVIEGRKATPPQAAEEFNRRERGALDMAWTGAALCLGPAQLARLEQLAVKEAARIQRKARRKPAGAVWLHWLGRHMASAVGQPAWRNAMYQARTGYP